MKHTRLITFSLVVVALAMLFSACGALTSPQTGSSAGPLKFGINQWAGYGSLFIADQKGYFTQNGVEVDITVYDTVAAMNKDLADGKLDGASVVEADAVSGALGDAVQIVWLTDSSHGGDQFVASASIEKVQDLRGKRIGFARGGFGQVFVAQGLAQFGLTLADVTPVDMEGAQVPAAVAAGQIDAGHSWDPFVSQVTGTHTLFTSADTPSAIVDAFVFRTEVIQSRPADVQKFVKSISDAVNYWKTNVDDGSQIVADGFKSPLADVTDALPGFLLLDLTANREALNRSSSGGVSAWQNAQIASNVFVTDGIIDQAPDIKLFINDTFVTSIAQ